MTPRDDPGEPSRLFPRFEALVGDDPEARRAAERALYRECAHQGNLYAAAVWCVRFLVEHARTRGRLSTEAVSVLEAILSARTPGLTASVDGVRVDVAAYCRRGMLELLPVVLAGADGEDAGHLREVCYLVPQLADSAPEVIGFLRAGAERFEGERRRMCREALAEAEEVARDGPMP